MKIHAKAGFACVALATAATMMLGVPSASGDHQSRSSAYGFSLGGSPGEPAAKFPEGPRSAGGELPAELEQLAAGGVLTVTAEDDRATAEVTDLTLGSGLDQLPEELRTALQQIKGACDQLPPEPAPDVDEQIFDQLPGNLQELIDTPGNLRDLCLVIGGGTFAELASVDTLHVECDDRTGSVAVSDVRIFGSTVPINDTDNVAANTSVLPAELEPLIKITLNRQTTEGEDFTVDGLVLELGGQEVAVLASTTCGGPIAHDRNPEPLPPAPTPTPVDRNVPVTG
ncbi:hypothetical protein SFC88_11760 [Nocardioides sp. HM23]|uniref:hypothetical protein n=1 Tax=Nocardioides bizhenqiangii TaxID=3095076 RepID=UPI002ACA5DAB|nr:hypothetical protein [Nocardioides sp. HM23]MDZ5621511.1 hypothetical protein [Nocardioides sp. HM23]